MFALDCNTNNEQAPYNVCPSKYCSIWNRFEGSICWTSLSRYLNTCGKKRERERKREKLPRCVMIQVKFALARQVHIGTPVPLANVQRSIQAEPWCIDYRISIGRVQYGLQKCGKGLLSESKGCMFYFRFILIFVFTIRLKHIPRGFAIIIYCVEELLKKL